MVTDRAGSGFPSASAVALRDDPPAVGRGVRGGCYDPEVARPGGRDPSVVSFRTRIWYCFGPDTCRGDGDPPGVLQTVTMKPAGGRYVISGMTPGSDPTL